ncbi:sugar transporter SWEET1 isoform X2 [Dunckerocampus dactyliophorus]|uniref:sugar transporter SWEET1 isoform X2 n=1 Tax=Dunckerocampus dactyliophorus TaxID=161453 RepID=UPI0024074C23|nr:sugar transporter SWEET1 isoform X2 [Dunckerocampus dactyliophorus]
MELLQLLSWACIVFTIGMFSTGLVDLKKMQYSKSTDNVQFLPFLTTCVNLGWLYYGILKRDGTLIVVNLIGVLLQLLYIVSYLMYTKQKRQVAYQIVGGAAVATCAWFYFSKVLPPGDMQLNQLGLICSVATVSVYLSPLTNLVAIVRSGNIQCLSFPLTVATFLTSTSWFLYGLQMNDYYILVPNLPGIFTSTIRFYLFWKFVPVSGSAPYKSMQI